MTHRFSRILALTAAILGAPYSHAGDASSVVSNSLNGIYKLIKTDADPKDERCPMLEYFQLRVSKVTEQAPMILNLDQIAKGFGIIEAAELMDDGGVTSSQSQDEGRLTTRMTTNKISDGYAMHSVTQQKTNSNDPQKIDFGSLLKTTTLVKDDQGKEVLVIAGYIQHNAGSSTATFVSWQCQYLKLQSEIYLGYFGNGNGKPQLVTP